MDQYASSLVAVPIIMQNSLNPLSISSITACRLLDFMVQGKMTEAHAPTIRLDATQSRLSVPPSPSSPILCQVPFLPQPSQFILAWDRHQIMLACICNKFEKNTNIINWNDKREKLFT